jgi:hypothetical protein
MLTSEELLVNKAERLRDFLLSFATSTDQVAVGVNKSVIHVYTKRKFKYAIPVIWEDTEVYHHRKGEVRSFRRLSDVTA